MSAGVARPSLVGSRKVNLILLVSGVASVVAMAWLINDQQAYVMTLHFSYGFGDLLGRVANLQNLRHTGNIYVPFTAQAFTYPPGAILFFWPILWVPTQLLTLVWTIGSLAALAGALFVALAQLTGIPRRFLAGLSCWAAVVIAAVFPEVTECLTWGQTATILLLLVLFDVLVLRGPPRGIMVGVATAVKIYPGLFIVLWLLRRQWRPALTALATSVAITSAAWIIWPASGRDFFSDLLIGGQEFQKLANSQNALKSNSVIAFFMRPPFHYGSLSPHVDVVVSVLVMAVALAGAYRLCRRGLEFSATMVVLIAGAIGAPVAWDHYFAFIPLLGLVALEAGADSALGRVSLIATAIALVPWVIFRTPTNATAWTATYAFVARNALMLATVSVVVTALVGGPRRSRVEHASVRLSPAQGSARAL